MEGNLGRLVAVQDQMMDLLGLSLEGQRRLATRTERMEENMERMQGNMQRLETTVQEIGDKLNGLIGVVDDFIRRKQ